MPISYTVLPKENLVVCIHLGTTNNNTILEAYTRLKADQRIKKGLNYLIDLSQEKSEVDHAAIVGLSKMHSEWEKRGLKASKIAVIAPFDLSYGLTRVYQSYADAGENHRLFRATDEALTWLKITLDSFQKAREDLNPNP